DARPVLPEDRVGRSDGQIADISQMVAAGDGIAVDARDNRLGTIEDDIAELPVERLEAAILLPLDVAASAECAIPCAGQHDHAERGLLASIAESAFHLFDGLAAHGVKLCRTVDGDGPHGALSRDDDVLERHVAYPLPRNARSVPAPIDIKNLLIRMYGVKQS